MVGSASAISGTWTLDGSGTNVWGASDEFRFAYQQVTGDVDIRVSITSLENVHDWSKAGVMIRESLTANARNAFLMVTPTSGRFFQWRSTTAWHDDSAIADQVARAPLQCGYGSSDRAVNLQPISLRTAHPGRRRAPPQSA